MWGRRAARPEATGVVGGQTSWSKALVLSRGQLRLACRRKKPFSFGSHFFCSGSTPTSGVMAAA